MRSRWKALQILIHHPLTLSFYLPAICFAIAVGMLVPVLPLYAADFEVSFGLVGLVLSGEAIGLLLADIPSGILLHRLGTKWMMLVGLGVTLAATAALFIAPTIWLVLLLRVVSGVGKAFFNMARHNFIASEIVIGQRGRAIALFGGMARVGLFMGPAIGGTVAAAFGLRAPFLLFGVFALVAAGLIAAFLNIDETAIPAAKHDHRFSLNTMRDVLRGQYRVLAAAGSGQLLAQMIRAGRQVILPLYASEALGLDPQAVGFVVSIGAAIDMTLFYPAGWIMDNLGRKYALVPTFAVQAAGMALVPLTQGFWGLALVAGIMGLGNGFSSGTMMTLGSDLAPEDTRGEFLGVWRLIGDSGATGAPILVGGIMDLFWLQPAAWTMALAGFGASAVFAFLVPETLKKKKRKRQPEPAPQS